ncbi:hypothetical protein KJK34_04650 [Flavobacterium sp. D11R37]|uniref:hypothetical protein n=1 Tax=Flavobacterium coralii TaxID=2838017 RepID=UPI001CA67063|nr:hypothetical protein [Flavobacterium coralii]MBY8962036.1 hypothetical protein [Flavobacterium coralii]
MATHRVKQAVAKVVYSNRIFNNGKNYIWIRISRAYLSTLEKYWRSKHGFHYMKIYSFDRKNRIVGRQIGYITLKGSALE